MKIVASIIFVFLLSSLNAQLDTLYSIVINSEDYRMEYSPGDYRLAEGGWKIWSEPFYISNDIKSTDKNLKTAWSSDSAVGHQFRFKPHQDAGCYCCGLDFFGVVNVFNGNCSENVEDWMECGRVKGLNIYWNDTLLCYVELVDTWHLQTFDIGVYFKCPRLDRNLNAPFEYQMKDQLVFEIAEIIEGAESNQICVSEFLWQGAPN